jgi:hypothetical protein
LNGNIFGVTVIPQLLSTISGYHPTCYPGYLPDYIFGGCWLAIGEKFVGKIYGPIKFKCFLNFGWSDHQSPTPQKKKSMIATGGSRIVAAHTNHVPSSNTKPKAKKKTAIYNMRKWQKRKARQVRLGVEGGGLLHLHGKKRVDCGNPRCSFRAELFLELESTHHSFSLHSLGSPN